MNNGYRSIVGLEGRYKINIMGEVRSVARSIVRKNGHKLRLPEGRIEPYMSTDGSCVVPLRKNAKAFRPRLSRLLWEAFNGAIPGNMVVDHIDRDPLNNTLSNLRLATRQQNCFNTKGKNLTSQYKGVVKSGSRWRAQIGINRTVKYLGTFDTEKEAAIAYDNAARQLHGEFFVPNCPDSPWLAPTICGNVALR